jgi:predicted transcriptional regulator
MDPRLSRSPAVVTRPVPLICAPAVFVGEEFDLARALIAARTAAGLSQAQLARRMETSQSYIARLEGGKVRPPTDALERFAHATRTRLRIVFEPHPAS